MSIILVEVPHVFIVGLYLEKLSLYMLTATVHSSIYVFGWGRDCTTITNTWSPHAKKEKKKKKRYPSCASSCRKAITLYHDIKPYLWTTPSGMIDPLQNLWISWAYALRPCRLHPMAYILILQTRMMESYGLKSSVHTFCILAIPMCIYGERMEI